MAAPLLSGLRSAARLNGREGVILTIGPADSTRVFVRLADGEEVSSQPFLGLADSNSRIQKSAIIHPNSALDRINPNPESIPDQNAHKIVKYRRIPPCGAARNPPESTRRNPSESGHANPDRFHLTRLTLPLTSAVISLGSRCLLIFALD